MNENDQQNMMGNPNPNNEDMVEQLDDNMFASAESSQGQDVLAGENSVENTGRDDEGRSRFFSLTQVSLKLNELWTSARERVFGEDYWIPSDQYEVVGFRSDLLACHKVLYPTEATAEQPSPFMVVQGSIKNEPSMALNHVVYTCQSDGNSVTRNSFSIFRSRLLEEAIDFCRRCDECRVLFRLLDKKKDIRKSIWDVTFMIKAHPLWRMVHIAISCHRMDIFTEEGLDYLKKFGYKVEDLTFPLCAPEGKYPLMLAIETQQEGIVRFLLKHGANPAARDPQGNNALHCAALMSAAMLETLWEFEACRCLLNSKNNCGETPARVAFLNFNPLCLKTLFGFGGEMLRKTTDSNPLFELMQSKGKTVDMIRVLLEASPKLLNERDEATGNTCLHAAQYKTSLMGLLLLKHKDLDLNVKNNAGLTPLHQYVSRGDLGLVMCLVSYGADLDIKADNGKMTPLHMAVSQKNVEITRFLLCLGANPNQSNEHGDTPRHLAAKLNAVELLKSLIICGARRCPSTKSGCGSGCVNKKSAQMVRRPSSFSAIEEAVKTKSPTTLVEEFESRSFVKNYRYNKVLDFEHNSVYEEMIKLMNGIVQNGKSNTNVINVLSLDGGGIRGLVIAQVMICVEQILGEPLFEYFDWVAGTSTGSIITAGLALGQTLRQIQRIYLRFKDLVFETRRPHNSAVLETFIQDEMGKDTKFNDIKWPRLIFTTTRADYFPVQLELMRNYKLPVSDEENIELGYKNNEDLFLWKVLRRSSAAPTYFSSVDNKYIDGGIISNNPSLELLQEIQFWNSLNKQKNIPNTVQIGCLLSIGTGAIPSIRLDPSHLELAQNYLSQPITSYNAMLTIGTILVDQVTATEGAPVARSGMWCIGQRTPYFRLSPPLHKDVQMDAKDDLEVARMMWDCMEYTYKHHDYVEKLCILLKKIGPAWQRRNLFQHSDCRTQDQQTQTSCPSSPAEEGK